MELKWDYFEGTEKVYLRYEDECFDPYASGIMNAALRDFIILNQTGKEVARVNLTGYNPDPSGSGECSGNYEAIKNMIINVIEN